MIGSAFFPLIGTAVQVTGDTPHSLRQQSNAREHHRMIHSAAGRDRAGRVAQRFNNVGRRDGIGGVLKFVDRPRAHVEGRSATHEPEPI